MANLTSIAQRLNDVEINNNAPVSSQTFRRVGSDINYLLDYLGVTNGATIGGPVTGLNVFSPVQSVSYSLTLTNTNRNTDVTLFTFTGGGDRPLRFFKRSSGLEAANATPSTDTSNGFEVAKFLTIKPNSLPILNILDTIRSGGGASTPSIFNSFIVKVNGNTVGAVTYDGSNVKYISSYNYEITMAPAGVNTVTVRPAFPSGTINQAITGSFEYVAL